MRASQCGTGAVRTCLLSTVCHDHDGGLLRRHRGTDTQTRRARGRRARTSLPREREGKRAAHNVTKFALAMHAVCQVPLTRLVHGQGPWTQRTGVGLPERKQNGEACGGGCHDEARGPVSQSPQSASQSVLLAEGKQTTFLPCWEMRRHYRAWQNLQH